VTSFVQETDPTTCVSEDWHWVVDLAQGMVVTMDADESIEEMIRTRRLRRAVIDGRTLIGNPEPGERDSRLLR
jgi:hypothetical protein